MPELARAGHTDGVTVYAKPPWPNNEIAVQHGAASERKIGPLAEQIVAEILRDPASPGYLQDGSYRLALAALGRTEVVVMLR